MRNLAARERAVALELRIAEQTSVENVIETASVSARPENGGEWFALGVTARHEKAVARILNQKGYETLLPLYSNRHQYGNRTREFELPVFAGYVFCHFDPAVRMPVLTTPGVLQIVGAGRTPISVDHDEISALRTAIRGKARMMPWPFWKAGQRGSVVRGPLAGLEGIVTTVKQSVRMVLSVSLLQRSLLVEVDADCVRPL